MQLKAYIQYINYYITNDDLDIPDLAETSAKLVDILNDIQNSEALDYEIERPLIEEIYELTLEFIKLEIKKTGKSLTLEEIKKNEIHQLNLDKAISTELSRLNLKDKKYTKLNYLIAKANTQGLDSTYVDFDIISHLIISDLNTSEKLQLEKVLKRKEIIYNSKIKSLKTEVNASKTRLDQLKEEIAEIQDTIKIETRLATISGVITASLLFGTIFGSLKWSIHREYKNTITTTSQDDSWVTEEYRKNALNKTYFCEAMPFHATEESFERTIEKYDVSGLGDLSIPEYLELNFESLGLAKEEIIETKADLSLSDLYHEISYTIEKIEVDINDFQDTRDFIEWLSYFSILLLSASILFVFFHLKISSISCRHFLSTFPDYQSDVSHNYYHLTPNFLAKIPLILQDQKRLKELKLAEITTQEDLEKLEYEYRKVLLDSKNIMAYVGSTLPILEEKAKEDKSSSLQENLTYLKKYLTVLKVKLHDIENILEINNQKRLTKTK